MVLRTERFDIHSHVIPRSELLGGTSRTVYQAWFHSEDIPKPVCLVTIWQQWNNYVEWIHVDDQYRRQGIATEVMRAIEQSIGPLMLDGVTPEGEAFSEAFADRR